MKFKIRYSREYTKIIYADNPQQAMFKFNRQADNNQDYIDCEEVKDGN